MNDKGLFALLGEIEPASGLYAAILEHIRLAHRRGARMRAVALGMLSALCGALFVPILQYAAAEAYASGFYDYFSLVFSDRGFVLSHWHEFALSLAESLPSLAILLVIAISAALAWSLRKTVYNARLAFSF
jgi:hypothetical protein